MWNHGERRASLALMLLTSAAVQGCADTPTVPACDAVAGFIVDVVLPTAPMVVGESRALTYRGIKGCDGLRALHTFEVAGLVSDSLQATPERILQFSGQMIIRAVDTGRVTLRVSLGSRDTSIALDVGPPLPTARLSLQPMSQVIAAGAPYRFGILAYDSLSRELPMQWVREPITWSSPDSFVVVRGDTITAYFTGTYPVTATWARGTATAELRVQAAFASVVYPFVPPPVVGDTVMVSATGMVFNTRFRTYEFARNGVDAVSVSDSSVARVWMTRYGVGRAVGLKPGRTVITTWMGAYSGSTYLTVSEPSPDGASARPH